MCIHLNGNPLLFYGGELQAEEEPGPSGTGACGSLLILSIQFGDQNWYNPGPDGEWGTDDDHRCE